MGELRANDRQQALAREEWITRFVNTVMRELQLPFERMVVVGAARDEWTKAQGTDPRAAAKDWAARGEKSA